MRDSGRSNVSGADALRGVFAIRRAG
jgi:hypothetical protein